MTGMSEQPPVNPYAATPQPLRPEDEKLWAIVTHLGGIFVPVLLPLITYLVLRDRGPFVRHHTATALNFHLTMLIAYVVGFVTVWLIIGFFIVLAVGLLLLILAIMAAVATSRGEYYSYPLSIAFVR